MAAAYARTLIRQGKAHLQSHPALPLLVLSRVVEAPTLRPVLLGLTLHATTATAHLFTEAHGTAPLFSVVIDLHPARPATAANLPPPARLMTLCAVIDRLRAAVPISEIAIAPSSDPSDPSLDTFTNEVAAVLPSAGYTVALGADSATVSLLPSPLVEAFRIVGTRLPVSATSPLLIAQHHPALEAAPAAHEPLTPAMLVRAQSAQRTVSGVVQAVTPAETATIAIPVIDQTAPAGHIQWQQQTVPIGAIGECWPAEPVLLLPVTTKGNR
jgi:hypothetical protein